MYSIAVITPPSGTRQSSNTTNSSSGDSYSVPANKNNAACVLVGTLAMIVQVQVYSIYCGGVAQTRLKADA